MSDNDINDTIRTADEYLEDLRERQRKELEAVRRDHQNDRQRFINSLQEGLREAIRLSKESFSNGDKYNGERYAFQVTQLESMLEQFS